MKKASIIVCSLLIVLSVVTQAPCEGMPVKDFEKKVSGFSDRVIDGQQMDFLATKKELLGDLYGTAYYDDFIAKYDTIVRYSNSLGFDIEKRLAACKSADEFSAVKVRYAEWNDFCRLADRAPTDYSTGVIQQLTMDKKRETALPFEVNAAKWEPAKQESKTIESYEKDLAAAEKVVSKALSALKSKNENAFAELFPEKLQLLRKAEPETSEINDIFKRELDEYWREDMKTEIAPLFLRNDLEEAAKILADQKMTKTVIRRWDGDKATFAAIVLEKPDGKAYVISNWAKGFDMQNRKR